MSILITGGSGFVGRYLIQRLLEQGDQDVVSMDIVHPPAPFMKLIGPYKDRFHFILGSVAQLHDATNAVKSFSVDKIVNLAFLLPPASETNLPTSMSVNIAGHVNVLEAARLFDVSRIVCISSIGVYGSQEMYGDRALTEDDEPRPQNIYGYSKYLGEKIADKYIEQHGLSIVSVRSSTVFGHGRENAPTGRILANLFSLPAVGKPVSVDIGRDDRYALIYVEDMAKMLHVLLDASSPKHRVYNNGGYSVAMGQLGDLIKENIPEAKIEFRSVPRPTKIPWNVSGKRLEDEFGFSVKSIQDAVLANINFARQEAGLKPI